MQKICQLLYTFFLPFSTTDRSMLPLQLPKSLKQSLSGQYLDKEVLDSYIVPILTRIFLPNFFSNNLCNSSDACDSSQPAAARFIFWYVPNFLPPTAAHVFFCCGPGSRRLPGPQQKISCKPPKVG